MTRLIRRIRRYTTHSTTTEVIEITIRLRYEIRLRSDYDLSRAPASIRREQKMNMSVFRRSCVVVVSQSNRTQIIISITSVVVECVVASSYRSRIVVESQLWYRLKRSATPSPRVGGHTHIVTAWRRAAQYLRSLIGVEGYSNYTWCTR